LLAIWASLVWPHSIARALVFAGPGTEPSEIAPPDFPYWEHVTQRRYEGPSVIYLGAGWALTAKHVGQGEILLKGEIIAPERSSRHTLLNVDGSPADALLFELDRTATIPDLPLLPIAKTPPEPGEEVVLVGFGRGLEKIVQWNGAPPGTVGMRWTKDGRKRWGTNRIETTGQWHAQRTWLTRSLVFRFDASSDPSSTPFEAHATTGDSGGGVFVKRDQGWELAGMMTSVTGSITTPPHTSIIGDLTNAADLSSYRSEILRWARPGCANEEDDDGDGLVDYPDDPGCDSQADRDERERASGFFGPSWSSVAAAGGVGLMALAGVVWMRSQRGRRTPSSTNPSSAV
jgi:hypothetical protein